MSTIQPGDGYTFNDSSSGFNINIDKPWTPPTEGGIMFGISLPKFPDPPLPPDIPGIPVSPLTATDNPLQFQCRVASVAGTATPVIQIAMGSVTYTQSLMPFIKTGPFTDHRQAYMNFAAVTSPDVNPVTLVDATSPWMLGGGGYALTGTGRWYVTLSKWDVSATAALGALLNLELPWVSIVKDDSDEFAALFVDAGPSLYQNTTNIQKMEGYQEVESEGETLLDWGHCHTTYFNPRFLGNHVRVLAVIDSVAAVPSTAAITVLRNGGPTVGNEIQLLTFLGNYKSGSVSFNYGAFTTTASFTPGSQNAYDLQLCLETIASLNGNVFVQSVAPGVYQIEFTNILRNTNVGSLSVNSGLVTFGNWYKISQCHVGSQDIVIPCELNATFLMNKADLTEADDPYYANANSVPPWANISNIEAARAASALAFTPEFATPVINDVVPRAFETVPLVYSEEAGCTGDDPSTGHPFKVIHVETEDGESTYRIIPGTVNNVTPGNIASTITVSTDEYEVWIKVPFAAGVFPAATGFEWNMGTPVPDDTASEGYVRIATVSGATVTQYVTGSLWADRIQVGAGATLNAFYYYARI
jgi:hypothetical protein